MLFALLFFCPRLSAPSAAKRPSRCRVRRRKASRSGDARLVAPLAGRRHLRRMGKEKPSFDGVSSLEAKTNHWKWNLEGVLQSARTRPACSLLFAIYTFMPPEILEVHSLTHPPNHPRTHALTHSLTHSRTHALTHSRTHALTHSLTHSLSHSLTHSLTHSVTHSLTHSLTHHHHHVSGPQCV